MKSKKKAKSRSWWRKKTVLDFNKYIRLLKSDKNGYCVCVTCGKRLHYKKAHAGHFQHGLHFIEDNQHPQCVRCNMFLSGNLSKYTLYMIDKYGRKRVDELIREGNKVHKYGIPYLRELRKEIRKKIKELKELEAKLKGGKL